MIKKKRHWEKGEFWEKVVLDRRQGGLRRGVEDNKWPFYESLKNYEYWAQLYMIFLVLAEVLSVLVFINDIYFIRDIIFICEYIF